MDVQSTLWNRHLLPPEPTRGGDVDNRRIHCNTRRAGSIDLLIVGHNRRPKSEVYE